MRLDTAIGPSRHEIRAMYGSTAACKKDVFRKLPDGYLVVAMSKRSEATNYAFEPVLNDDSLSSEVDALNQSVRASLRLRATVTSFSCCMQIFKCCQKAALFALLCFYPCNWETSYSCADLVSLTCGLRQGFKSVMRLAVRIIMARIFLIELSNASLVSFQQRL
jgi:hypothetical protein